MTPTNSAEEPKKGNGAPAHVATACVGEAIGQGIDHHHRRRRADRDMDILYADKIDQERHRQYAGTATDKAERKTYQGPR